MRFKTIACVTLLALPTIAAAQAPDHANAAVDTALTLYNDGAAVVSQTRPIDLKAGRQTLQWPTAPSNLLPDSLWVAGNGIDLLSATVAEPVDDSPMAWLSGRIGKSVTLLSADGDERCQATLVSVSGSHAVVRVDGRMEFVDIEGEWRIAWPAAEDRMATGALQLTVTAADVGKQPLTLVYQRPGLNWHTSYTGIYDAASGQLTLQPMAVISNKGSSPVHAGQVALIAGEVNRASSSPRPMFMARAAASASKVSDARKVVGGYYRYQLNKPVDLAAGATQLLPLMSTQVVDAEREYYIGQSLGPSLGDARTHAKMRLHFVNSTGKPLPAAAIRVYGGAPTLLLGEDRIGNTPTGAPVTLTLGRAFDVTAEKHVTQASHQDDSYQRTVEIRVFNARDKVTHVTIARRLPRGAEIVSESASHDSKTADLALWHVKVPAHGKNTLTYSIHWQQ